MGITTDEESYTAVTCSDCDWLGYAADADTDGNERVCPECGEELKIA